MPSTVGQLAYHLVRRALLPVAAVATMVVMSIEARAQFSCTNSLPVIRTTTGTRTGT